MTTLSFERDPGNAGLGDTAAFYEADLTVPVSEHAEREKAAADGFSIAMSGAPVRSSTELSLPA